MWEPLGKDGATALVYLHLSCTCTIYDIDAASPAAGPKTDKLKLDFGVKFGSHDRYAIAHQHKKKRGCNRESGKDKEGGFRRYGDDSDNE